MKIVCISDTHNSHDKIELPDGDMLIHGGDHSNSGTVKEVAAFLNWFADQPHKHKIFIAGNHDLLFERDPAFASGLIPENIIYLQDSAVIIDGLKIYGSPWQPRSYDWAFNLMRGDELAQKWKLTPDDTDILITHGPPNGILDSVQRQGWIENTGCEALKTKIDELRNVGKLKLHIFGHIHCGYGITSDEGITFINASTCDEAYIPINPPIIAEI